MNTALIVSILIISVIFSLLNFIMLLTTLHTSQRISESLGIIKLRIDNIYEKSYRLENMLQNLQMHAIMDSGMNMEMKPMRAIRTPDGKIIMATSLEDFLQKVHNDPNFRGISKSELDQLRKLFEEHTSNDEDEPDEPWKKEE